MEGEAVAAVIQGFVQNLIDHSKKDISLIRGLNKEAAKLADNLETIQKMLNDAESRTIPGGAVKSWLTKLEDVAFDADNVLDELNYHLLSKQINSIKPMKEKVLSCFSSPCVSISRSRNMALRIQEINENLESIHKEAPGLRCLREMPVTSVPIFPTIDTKLFTFDTELLEQHDSFTLDPIFIGRDELVLEIVDTLTACMPSDEQVSILAIVGMGGLGKTALARKVINHLKKEKEAHFGSYIWVHVSKNFDPIVILRKILKGLPSSSYYKVEIESMRDVLQEALKDRTYLLILDNVWNIDSSSWNKFIDFLSNVTSVKGNAIVVTTRITEVGTIVRADHTHELKGLSENDFWTIIKEKSLVKEDYPSEFEVIGKKIATRCQGLPLAANVVGRILRNESDETWRSIEENWLSRNEGDHITKILRLSFDNLSSESLKKCFTYCSIFPKGHKMVRQELIELWMLDGFLEHDESNDMESMGNNFFNILLHHSLLVVEERDAYGNVESCVMHNLMHDLASSILGETPHQVRWLHHGDGDGYFNKRTNDAKKYLSTLIFQGEIIGTTFSGFKSLHVLTLDCNTVTELPSSIRKLISLRYLNISRTRIEKLPKWICKLGCLKKLYALTRSLRELPSTFVYLSSLQYFYIQSGVKLPPRIGRLTNLQALKFTVGELKGYKIEELGSLDNLERLSIDNLEKVADIGEAKKAKLHEKQKLSTLELEWGENGEGGRNDEPPKNKKQRDDKAVLEGLEPHQELKVLKIAGFKGKSFPSWIVERRLDRLIEITLSSCQEFEEIRALGDLPNLKVLRLSKLSNVRSINSLFSRTGKRDRVIFPLLESMSLLNMAELSERIPTEFANKVKVFPCLQSLKIHHCYKLECLPNWLFRKTHRLSELDIKYCPMLRALPDGLQALDSLEQLTIRGCRNLKSIAYPSGGRSFTSLHSLEIHNCHELVEMVEPSAPLLKKVSVVELKSLQNIPRFLRCLEKSQFLEQLTVAGVPGFTSSSSGNAGVPGFTSSSSGNVCPFRRLKKLEIDAGGRPWSKENRGAIDARVDNILQNCHFSLKELTLTGLEIWDCLPKSIEHLKVLHSLELEGFGVEALPEWIGHLSSLTKLCLSDFTNLKGLPSMQSLTKLQEFHIHDCPKLPIESERNKLSSHTLIYFNGHKL